MKRYNLIPIDKNTGYIIQGGKVQTIESNDGEWVKYEDMQEEMIRIWGDIMPPPQDKIDITNEVI
jgi:hypothetical protein